MNKSLLVKQMLPTILYIFLSPLFGAFKTILQSYYFSEQLFCPYTTLSESFCLFANTKPLTCSNKLSLSYYFLEKCKKIHNDMEISCMQTVVIQLLFLCVYFGFFFVSQMKHENLIQFEICTLKKS